jgi:MocE subfamily Rieske [2Fe-2S] domain protein
MLDEHEVSAFMKPPSKLDYSLTGVNSTLAVERGLAEAEWYQSPVARSTMRKLLERRDWPALRDSIIWFGLILGSAYAAYRLWGTWWCVIPFAIYGVLYASTSDSRWHEAGHGTAFKTDWMNNVLYEIASFMVMRESTVWRWSHTRHHSDTIIVGRDPEISVPRPPDIKGMFFRFLSIPVYRKYFYRICLHSLGMMTADEKTFVPQSEFAKIFGKARIYLAIYLLVIGISIWTRSILPLMFIGLPHLYGTWLMPIYGFTQHAGLAENVLDHRLNCRTVYMNPINRFLYWNMNYHVEHHMFPLVPYHALPELHAAVKDDMPEPYPSLLAAWREIIPAVLRQVTDPAYYVKRKLPEAKPNRPAVQSTCDVAPDAHGWVKVCAASDLRKGDAIRFDHRRKTFALYRDYAGELFATDGMCTHGNTHLSDGLVIGTMIECPKHNGRFNLRDGSPARAPICRGLATYAVEQRGERLHLNVERPGGAGARAATTFQFRVIATRSVATFIKEITLEPIDATAELGITPGDYLQVEIPFYEVIRFSDFDIPEPYAAVWRRQHLFDLSSRHDGGNRRNNYSIASNPRCERQIRLNVRIAMPPTGQDCPPGVGSAYMFSLKPGDIIAASGPYGDFHIKPTQRELIYIGGGAGMGPLRSHLSCLFDSESTARKVSFWYGARSRQEIYYQDYFQEIERKHANFSFHIALSAPLPDDNWTGKTGLIHDVVLDEYLRNHPHPAAVEFYLCGPPMMIKACLKMLQSLDVPPSQIAYDEF